jgi:hypothetical protein
MASYRVTLNTDASRDMTIKTDLVSKEVDSKIDVRLVLLLGPFNLERWYSGFRRM